MAINNNINNKSGKSNSGSTNTFTVDNASDTLSSSALCLVTVGGSTADDPKYQNAVSGVTTWSHGCDNSASDAWVLSQNASLGTNNAIVVATDGIINYPLQSAVFALKSTTTANFMGDNGTYGIVCNTEIFDQNSDYNNATGSFTAPVTGKYQLFCSMAGGNIGSQDTFNLQTTTSNRGYRGQTSKCSLKDSGNILILATSFVCDMDAADTLSIAGRVLGVSKTISLLGDATNALTAISIKLIC